MLLDLLWNEHPPITKFFFLLSTALGILVNLEPDMESKMYLIRGNELEAWRYFTNILYAGKISMKFFVGWTIM